MIPTIFEPASAVCADYSLFGLAADPLTYVHVGPERAEGRLRVLPEVHSPAFRLGLEMMRKPHVVLLGLSPGNGFFSRKRVEIAVCGFAHLSGNLAVIVPDAIAIHTYRALGYTEHEGWASVKRNSLSLKSRCRRAIEISRGGSPASVRMLDWDDDVSSQALYEEAYAEVRRLFETHQRFRKDVLLTALSVVQSKTDSLIGESALVECSQYLLKELAYFRVCRALLGMDVLIPYHNLLGLGVGANFCEGLYGEPVPGVGWAVYDIDLFCDASGGPNVEQ